MRILPPVVSSRPAIRRRSVDLPQPDGPTKTTKAPSSTVRLTFEMTLVVPKLFSTPSRTISPILSSETLFDRAERHPAHQLLLTEPAHDQDRRDRQRRCR